MWEVAGRCAGRFGLLCELKLDEMPLDVAFIDGFGYTQMMTNAEKRLCPADKREF